MCYYKYVDVRGTIYFLASFFACFFCYHNIAKAETAIGTALVEIKTQLVISEVTPMNFGTILVDENADTITLGLSNDITISGTSSTVGSTAQTGSFSVTGTADSSVSISFANGNLTGTGNAMNITNFIHDAGSSPQFDNSGNLTFAIGADLQINNNQQGGSYTGTYQVTVNYQ
tara:strand:- start:4816 stop:5334 length:519 start_codon:yes stop_codon:yes gene_type:complete